MMIVPNHTLVSFINHNPSYPKHAYQPITVLNCRATLQRQRPSKGADKVVPLFQIAKLGHSSRSVNSMVYGRYIYVSKAMS